MNMANILNNQGIAQALAEGLTELSKENSVSVSLNKSYTKAPTLKYIFSSYLLFFLLVYPFRSTIPQRNYISL